MKRHVPRFKKIRPDANNKNFMEQDGNKKKEKRHSTLNKKIGWTQGLRKRMNMSPVNSKN